MIEIGNYNELKVDRKVDFGIFLDDGEDGILLPKRFVPTGAKIGDTLKVFLYHDSDDRIIATTLTPKGIVGDIVKLKVVDVTHQGAFLDWGLMKDLFVPKSQQLRAMKVGEEYMVKIYLDKQTGRVAATEKIENHLNNDVLTVKELQLVDLIIFRKTEIGYAVIINNVHLGLLHFNEVFKEIKIGDHLKGFIKKIKEDNKIDVMPGKPGYLRVEDEAGKILQLLKENNGFLPYNDKSDPEDIYTFFGMSKKTFKMTVGNLYKQKLITLTPTGIRLRNKE